MLKYVRYVLLLPVPLSTFVWTSNWPCKVQSFITFWASSYLVYWENKTHITAIATFNINNKYTIRSIVCKVSCHLVIQSSGHLVIQSFGHLVIWSIGHSVNLVICHSVIQSLFSTLTLTDKWATLGITGLLRRQI